MGKESIISLGMFMVAGMSEVALGGRELMAACTPPAYATLPEMSLRLTVGDIDNDGHDDLIVANTRISQYRGRFLVFPGVQLLEAGMGFRGEVIGTVNACSPPYDACAEHLGGEVEFIGDWDDDGMNEFAVGVENFCQVVGTGLTTGSAGIFYDLGRLEWIASEDIGGDGRPDRVPGATGTRSGKRNGGFRGLGMRRSRLSATVQRSGPDPRAPHRARRGHLARHDGSIRPGSAPGGPRHEHPSC